VSGTSAGGDVKVGRLVVAIDGCTKGYIQAVCVSACGNFGFAGTSSGVVEMWNMQSGAKRKAFALGPSPGVRRTKSKKSAHRVISGIATDSLNRIVIASTLDGSINVRSLKVPLISLTLTVDLVFRLPFSSFGTRPAATVELRIHRPRSQQRVVSCDVRRHGSQNRGRRDT
jgi:hypothetical protein